MAHSTSRWQAIQIAVLPSGTNALVSPVSLETVPVTYSLISGVANQDVDANIFYGAGDNTLFANLSPGQTISLARGATADTTTLARSADGLSITITSTNPGTGVGQVGTTVVAS